MFVHSRLKFMHSIVLAFHNFDILIHLTMCSLIVVLLEISNIGYWGEVSKTTVSHQLEYTINDNNEIRYIYLIFLCFLCYVSSGVLIII
jgi:hypothetical protein